MTPRENLHAFYERRPFEWKPVGTDKKGFQPEEICEYVARAFVMQQDPYTGQKMLQFSGPDGVRIMVLEK